MRVLVTGAGGMLGGDVVETCEAARHEVIALTREALDITDGPAVDEALRASRPDVVVNCAAWTDVDGAEEHPDDASRVNDEGAALVAGAAAAVGAKFVFLSTDYVFDGSKRRPYLESDPTEPLSAYGRSKLGGETSVAVANPDHFIVRTSWLFGTGGRNFVETMLALAEEQPEVLVVSDQVGCPTYTGHLAEALCELAAGREFGVHHIAAGGRCSWYDFAQEIFDQAGLDTAVLSATTDMLARPAPRPAYSVMRSARRDPVVLPHWREGLAAYLAQRQAAPPAGAGSGVTR
jgi:dTDP-4-dehydrorhamnose reductase